MRKAFFITAALAIMPAAVKSQTPVGVSPVYRRAQTLVNDGNVTAGRALVDSMIAVAAPGSNDYAEGVYWRAVLAATAADAEMDYRRIVVDFPLSPRVDDALIRLAQLEIARANYDGALRHLNRLAAEHPQSPARARAGYWTARALFDKNDIQGGCAATANALALTSENDTELRNQITYLNQRCSGVVLSAPVTAPGDSTRAGASRAGTPVGGAAPVAVPITETPAIVPPRDTTTTRSVSRPPAATIPDSIKVVATEPVRTKESLPQKSRPQPPSKPLDTGPSMVEPLKTIPDAPAAPVSSGGGKAFSVQVAAYNVKSQADAMVVKLKKNGYEARVDGKAAPFRVRIGRYATQAQASAVQRSLKAKQIDGFVVQADIK